MPRAGGDPRAPQTSGASSTGVTPLAPDVATGVEPRVAAHGGGAVSAHVTRPQHARGDTDTARDDAGDMTPVPPPESPSRADVALTRPHHGSDSQHRSAFPAIASYAFLSDCESNCLISPSGAV